MEKEYGNNNVNNEGNNEEDWVDQFKNYMGPIPDASVLAEYENLLPGSASRILTFAENESIHRQLSEMRNIDIDEKVVTHAFTERVLGQIFGFLICIMAITAGTFTALNGANIAGGLIGTGGVIGLVAVFMLGRK